LSHLSPTFLKIDKSLLPNPLHNDVERSRKLFAGAVTLGHAIDALVIAEGIEDDATRDFAVELGADLLQGFAIAPAMPAVELVEWVAARVGD
jgi:two-component system CheB/CheR fusion protein